MAYEFFEETFGTPKDGEEPKAMTYAELEAAIDADKKIQVVDVKAGGYVSKEKLDAKITELDGVKQQLSDANTTIQSYKDMDIDGIKQSAKDWETKYTQETQKLTAQLAAQERNHALDMFMGGYKFSSKPAENGVRAEFEKKNFTLEDGKFLGGDEFIKSLMENDDYKGSFCFLMMMAIRKTIPTRKRKESRSLQEELAELAEPEAKESREKKHSLIRSGST